MPRKSVKDYPAPTSFYTFEGNITRATDKAILVEWKEGKKNRKVWVPLSQATIVERNGDHVKVSVPDWLADRFHLLTPASVTA